MITALVTDCNSHLGKMEEYRVKLECAVAQGADDECLRFKTQDLTRYLADYKNAAKHCKKHITPPKQPKNKRTAEEPKA